MHHDKEKTTLQADCETLRSRVAELEEQARKARLDSETLRACCKEKQDENEYMKLFYLLISFALNLFFVSVSAP